MPWRVTNEVRRLLILPYLLSGMHSLILKGLVLSNVEAVTIGRGSVIGAGSVVVHDIPPGVIAAGNPARVVKEL